MSEAGPDDTEPSTASGGGGSGGGVVRTWGRRVGLALVALVVVVAALYALGVVGAPSAGLADRGDWGTVTEERTEIVTTVWVNNPNPVGVSFGDTLTADYDIVMNDVVVAEGHKSDIAVPSGNDTVEVRTDLLNDRLSDWWVGFVRAGETIHMRVDATLTVDAFATVEYPVTINRTIMADSAPVIGALSSSVNATSGTYTQEVEASQVDDSLAGDLDLAGGDSTATVGYEVQRGWATWQSVNESHTTVRFHVLVHNPGDVPVPAAPDGVGVAIDANDVRLLHAESDEFTLRSVGPDAVIEPGETREVTFDVTMDNERIDEWFTSHVREDAGPGAEATTVSTQFQVVFRSPATGTTFRVPGDSPATYDCEFRTAILVDGREPSTTCGQPTAPVGD